MATTLNSNALITLDEFRELVGDSTQRDLIEGQYFAHINAASQAIENYLNRVVCPTQDITEKFDGDGTPEYYAHHKRINGTPTLYYYNGIDWTELTSTDYVREVTAANGSFEFMRGHLFGKAVKYKLSYNTGWDRGDVPGDIKAACARLVHRALQRADGKEGIQSQSFGDTTTTYSFDKWPDDLRAVLDGYRQVGGV